MTKSQQKLLEKIPVAELVKATRARVREQAAELGPYATMKKLTSCPRGCGLELGVRELRRHLSAARQTGKCPVKQIRTRIKRSKKAA